MNIQDRIELLIRLGDYMLSEEPAWLAAREKAAEENGWFIPEFTGKAIRHIGGHWLRQENLEQWLAPCRERLSPAAPRTVGIVMAGNIPLVGFHDWLSVFVSGHRSVIKLSVRDSALLLHLLETLESWDSRLKGYWQKADMLKGCDAYIATGSNNSSRYFAYYFSRYPHIIRRNKTSAAFLTGEETDRELESLTDDVFLYFGLGCRNVTKLYVPEGYDFVRLLEHFNRYLHLADHHKYKNNYDYNLALHLLNRKYYMTNGVVLLVEEKSLFSPISQLHYEFYTEPEKTVAALKQDPDLQCLAGRDHVPFGQAQYPDLEEYADGVNTLSFLNRL